MPVCPRRIRLYDSYGYSAFLIATGYHLFPDLAGNPDEVEREAALKSSETFLSLLMAMKSDDPWLAGEKLSLADFFLAPFWFYIMLTPDADRLSKVSGNSDWWERMQSIESFKSTEPDLG